MAASETVVKSLALTGLTPLTADESHQVLEQLIVSGADSLDVLRGSFLESHLPALADGSLRTAFAAAYPEAWARIDYPGPLAGPDDE